MVSDHDHFDFAFEGRKGGISCSALLESQPAGPTRLTLRSLSHTAQLTEIM